MSRREFDTKTKVAAFKRAGGKCEDCGRILGHGYKTHYDHAIADGLGGEPTLANCVVLCQPCHDVKTATLDIPAIAKAKRREAAHIGATRPAGKIKSPGFAKPAKPPRETRAPVPGLSNISRRFRSATT